MHICSHFGAFNNINQYILIKVYNIFYFQKYLLFFPLTTIIIIRVNLPDSNDISLIIIHLLAKNNCNFRNLPVLW